MSDPVARTLPQCAVEAAGTHGALQLRNSYETGNRPFTAQSSGRGRVIPVKVRASFLKPVRLVGLHRRKWIKMRYVANGNVSCARLTWLTNSRC